jgi:DNA-binding SARP family transcriptional activator/Tfp pilus assembly protein PilF
MPLRVGVLGPVSAWRSAPGGTDLELAVGQPRQQAVLGMLAVRANRVVSRADLIDAVWGDQPPASAEGGIYTYVAGLRRVLEPDRPLRDIGASRREAARVLVSAGGGYMLRLEPACLDAVVFEQGLTRYRAMRAAGDLGAAERALDGALVLWRGEAFTGVPGPFAEAERMRLSELRTLTTEERADLLLARGRPAEAVVDLTALVAEFPLRERARALLMTALYRCGRQADALEAFQEARTRLAEELGIDPGSELTAVHQQVLAMDPALAGPGDAQRILLSAAAGTAPGAELAPPVPAQIPPEVAGFAGRDAELTQLRAALPAPGGTPIVVLTGTAGVGKTALAVRFAHEVASQFPDGQLYANLHGFDPSAAPADPSAALRAFLEALRVPGSLVPTAVEAQTGLLRSMLDGKRLLLLLDNAQTTSQVRPLLPGSPGCMVVVTSRDQLAGLVAAEGARLIPLDVLSEDEARDMLAARLGAARLAAEPAAVAELIRQSARLPLALSVASARAVTRPGIALAALTAELRDARVRLDPLEAGDVATDLRAVFSWSQARLSPSAARMFRLQGVIPGPDLTAAVAASLAGVPLAEARSALTELCRASLLTEDAAGRLGCHDLLRAYAAEQARAVDGDAQVDAAQRRVLDHYLRTSHDAALKVYPARFKITLLAALPGVTPERIESYEDIAGWFRAEQKALMAAVALAGARDSDPGPADCASDGADLNVYCWQLAWSCAPQMMRLGHWVDMAAALRTALEAAQRLEDPVGQALVHYEVGYARCRLGEFDEADRSLRNAVRIATGSGDLASLALAHHGLCLVYDQQGRYADALPHAREALRLRSSLGDSAGVAYAENTVGWIYGNLGQPAEALRHCRRALELHRASGSRSGVADTLDSIGFAHEALGEHEAAIDHYQQSVALFREIGDPRGEATALIGFGDVQLAIGQLDGARASWELALSLVTAMPGGDSGPVRGRLAGLPASVKVAALSDHGSGAN